ncbi:MAG: hypothetical protein JWL70_31 [Acidimicrobiia bacterium]|nr:hypothetical protein [Acidimicrobiia bacterium]
MTAASVSDAPLPEAGHTWIPHVDPAAGVGAFDQVVNHRPDYADALRRVEAAIWHQELVDTELLQLCQRRIAQLLRHRSSADPGATELVDAVSSWPTDPRFSDRHRVCLAYAEQLLIDAEGVTDQQAAAVVDALGEGGFMVLTYACGFFETRTRADLVLGLGRLS